MSALARYYLSNGHTVSGSDSAVSPLTEELVKEGIKWVSDNEVFSEEVTLHIYSEAVPENDIQRLFAKEKGIKSISYFRALGEISKEYKTIAVSGTHGKSTTTAMIGITLKELGIDPLVIVGTLVREFGGKNVTAPKHKTNNSWFIVEACEYRENFLALEPFALVLLNCEWDHIDYFKCFEDYKKAFIKLVRKIPENGFLVLNAEDKVCLEISREAKCKVIPIKFSDIKNPIKPQVPGWHNQMNAEIAKAVCLELAPEKEKGVIRILEKYAGAWRRFDVLGEKEGVLVIDDYAHHPTEISTTLKSLFEKYPDKKKYILVFQPHQYSRTKELFEGFMESFDILKKYNHKLYITDIYEARDSEEDKRTVSSDKLANAIRERGIDAEASGDYESTLKIIRKDDLDGNPSNVILFTMGAGPVNELAKMYLFQ